MGIHGVFVEVLCDEPGCEELLLKEVELEVTEDRKIVFDRAVPIGWGRKPGALHHQIFCPLHKLDSETLPQ